MGNRSPSDASVRRELGLPERYEVLRRVASGGMASVWCAQDRSLGRKVAIKLLTERFADDEDANERFMREARVAARLCGHPHVVMIYDVGETTGAGQRAHQAFIVMEYLAGGTVADALRVDSVRRVEAVRWLHETASALDYAHGRGVLHRDIKPANLLLDRGRVLHVADFGIARLGTEDTITGSGQVLGTASYLAPERALGRRATEASDRYSLAVAAFELLVGERPFTARQFTAQARQHLEAPPPSASNRNRTLPQAVDAVLARGMAKRPEERWPSAQEFAQALEAALSEAATRAYRTAASTASAGTSVRRTAPRTVALPPVDGRRPRRFGGRVPALAALAAGTAVAIAAAGTIGGGRSHTSAQASASVQLKTPPTPTNGKRAAAPAKAHVSPPPATASTTTPTSATTTTSTTVTSPPSGAMALESRGHELLANGDYTSAIAVLRQAVATADPASLTYAYALYDLGRALRLAGDARDAVSVLWRRMQIPNQTGAVRLQLQLALVALGQNARNSGGTGPAPPGQRRHGVRANASNSPSRGAPGLQVAPGSPVQTPPSPPVEGPPGPPGQGDD